MSFALTRTTGDGSTATFNVPFSYRATADVVVKVAGVTKTITTHYTFPTASTIQFTAGNIPANGAVVEIRRATSHNARLVDYVAGATLTETDLDTDSEQAFFISQEAIDYATDTIALNANDKFDALSKQVQNLADPTLAQDAVTKNYLESTFLTPSTTNNINTLAPYATQLGLLGTADAIADMNTLGTADVVADMNTLGTADVVNDMNTLATADVVADMNTLASADIVADMALLASADVIADMNLLATSDVISDMNTLATADVVADMNTLGTADVVADMNTLGTADVVSDMNTLGTASNVTNMSTVATNIGNVNTCATNISDITAASQAAGVQTVDNFNGDSSTTAFTLSANPETENNTAVYIDGVYQQKNTYSLSGTTLTFSTAPPTGTNNIEVMHLSTQPTGVNPTIGTTTTGAAGTNASVSVSGHELSFTIPRGDTGATGPQGSQGIQGVQGPSGTISVGTVTTGAAGSSATVTNSGTSTAATFDFSIPKGDTGATGPQGPQGDTGPAGSLSGASDGTAGAPSISFSADTDTGVYRPGADQIGFTTGGSERVHIASDGVVSIGTSNSPSNKDTVTPSLVVNGSGVDGAMQVNRHTSVGGGGALLELTATRGSDVNSYTILQDGDGIGSVAFSGADGTEFVNAAAIQAQVDGTPGDDDMPGRLVFKTTADGASSMTERMRIDSAGHVAVGTTTTGNTSFTIATNSSGVTPNTTGDDLFVESSGNTGVTIASGTASQGRLYFADSGNAIAGRVGYDHTDDSMYFGTNGVNERMTIDSSGNVGIGVSPSYKLHVSGAIYATGDVTAFSSAVAKDNIETIPDALDIVEQLRGVTFDWKESGKKAVGLIYEEVKEVIPELTSNDGDNPGVAYQNSVALLIEAVKTLSARVKELEDK